MRYFNRNIFLNTREAYRRYLKKRGKENIIQYATGKFKHPTAKESLQLNVVNHIWQSGDKYFKLADQYYSDPEMWWVIALYNQKPTEFHVNAGDIIYVPTPLDVVLYQMGF